MTFTAVVTNYRYQFRGQCVALVSSVQGSLAPAAPSTAAAAGSSKTRQVDCPAGAGGASAGRSLTQSQRPVG